MTQTQYFQNDPRWKDVKIGMGQNLTIGMVGCLLTSLTMVLNHFGADETPLSLNQRMVSSGGYSGAWIRTAAAPGQFPALGVKQQRYVSCKNQPAPMADIDAGLAAGALVVVQVDREADRSFEEEDGHWLVLCQKEGDDYLMWDPWQKQGAPETLVRRYGFGYKRPEEIIQAAIWYGKSELPRTEGTPLAPATPPVLPVVGDDEPMAVRPTAELTLRRQPARDPTNVIKTVPVTAVLAVLDLPSQARDKIGQQGQWLHVREPGGSEGYVAAWYVQELEAGTPMLTMPASEGQHQEQPSAADLKVKTTADGVSLRSAPRRAEETFIRALPLGTVLAVIESGAPAHKIGQQEQWLQVQTAAGQQGYVAAWYVMRV